MAKKDENISRKKVRKKVGRPKKRGRKKKSYYVPKKKRNTKTVKKGISKNVTYQRVRKVLWEQFKNDFLNYREFISNKTDVNGNKIKGTSIVSLVLKECKDLDCNEQDIVRIYRQIRGTDDGLGLDIDDIPLIPDSYFDPRPYWEIIAEDWWSGLDERLWIVSDDLLFDPNYFLAILGSDRCIDKDGKLKEVGKCDSKLGDRIVRGKAYRFQEFVNYCNEIQQFREYKLTTDDVPHFRFAGENIEDESDRQPFYNEETKRWEINIVIVTYTNEIKNFNFNPKEPDTNVNIELVNQIIDNLKKEDLEEPIIEPIIPIDLKIEPTKKEKEDLTVENIELLLKESDLKIKEAEARIKEAETKEKELKLEEKRSDRKDILLNKFLSGEITAEQLEGLLKLV